MKRTHLFSVQGCRCDGVSRRDFLHVGILSALGLSLAESFRLQALAGSAETGTATSCILIWLDGGPSHLDTFDPKPEAPREIRSEFKAIPTAVPGLRICEHLPRTAARMGDVALIRSVTHELGNHDTGARFMWTGHRPTPSLEYPSMGSVVAREKGFRGDMPPYIAIPGVGVGGNSGAAGAGYLSGAYSAFSVGRDGSGAPDLALPEGVSFERLARRRDLLERMDNFQRMAERAPETADRDAFYKQAYRLVSSPVAKRAFDLDAEPARTRDRYGRSQVGSSCLLARRLVEAGARFVTVVDDGWDMHQQIFRELPDSRFPGSGKLPALDRAYAGLLEDLKERGLLETTLVVLMGEFGRTPKLNAAAGRDHWPRAGFACLAGGGVRGGQAIGSTDAYGETPAERPVRPPDLTFSILRLLGIDPSAERITPSGRPVKILSDGEFIRELT